MRKEYNLEHVPEETEIPEETEMIPEKESKADKFKRLAVARTKKAMKSIEVLGNLSERTNYEYTDEAVNKIKETLLACVLEMSEKFETKEKKLLSFEL